MPLQPRRHKLLRLFIGLLLISAAVWASYATYRANRQAPAERVANNGSDGRRGGSSNRAQTVRVMPAQIGEMPITIYALGSIVPNQTVTVRPLVSGRLEQVLFREGQLVKAGQSLAQIDARPFTVQLTQAQGQLRRDQALLTNARLDLSRYQSLLALDSISQQQVDTQAALVRQYEGTVQTDEAQVANARLQLTYTKVNAPISGRIGLRLVDAGNLIQTSDVNGLAVINQVQPISALFSVPQDRISEVLMAMRAQSALAVEALKVDQKTAFAQGELITTDNQIDPATGTVRLKARFENADEVLFPNQFVSLRLRLRTEKDAILVPNSALLQGVQGPQVFVISQGKAHLRRVFTGPGDDTHTVIRSGLTAGEQVAIDGTDRLKEGARVSVAPAADAQNSAAAPAAHRKRSKPSATHD